MTTVNYDVIVQALKDRANEISGPYGEALRLSSGDSFFIRDMRTIGFHAPRQSGRSTWVMNEMVKNPGTLVITVNKPLRDALVLRQCQGDSTYVKGIIKVDRLEDIDKRVITLRDLAAMMGERGSMADNPQIKHFELSFKIDQIILDDAHVIFDRLRRNKFYDWAARVFDVSKAEDPFVVLVN